MKNNSNQKTLFDIKTKVSNEKITDINSRFLEYNLEAYIYDIEVLGLETTWNYICQFVLEYNDTSNNFLKIDNFGELYEIGLAVKDKILKKKSGQYYTPDDVAKVMANWMMRCKGSAICDVACGTGKLILTYLDLIGYKNAREIISSGKLYLYDFDNVALKICRTIIAIKYGLDIAKYINDIYCDFLDETVVLPEDCIVISNPPYAKIRFMQDYWQHTDVLLDTKEYYSAFMEKIFIQAKYAVIITPFSFISGAKFYSLRKLMSSLGYGFVVAFDNVPGNIFCGRKHGIFNTNTANSVRAAITVMHKSVNKKGFKISPLIRFKNEERQELLKPLRLEQILPLELQIVNDENIFFKKIEKSLTELFYDWVKKSEYMVKDLVSKTSSNFYIDIPNTCRYYTTASKRKLNRTGSISLNIKGEDEFNILYCMMNSSFAYWWWRVYDGGITYPLGLINKMPIPINIFSTDDKKFFSKMAKELMKNENRYIVIKTNAGSPQENIKFPEYYRIMINKRLLKILGHEEVDPSFKKVHDNRYFGGGLK